MILISVLGMAFMKRGDIYIADLNPTVGSEIKKKRPVIIVSNDISNLYSDTITAIPITSNIKKVHPFEILIQSNKQSGLTQNSKAQCHQIRALSKTRFVKKKVGAISLEEQEQLESALRLHLVL